MQVDLSGQRSWEIRMMAQPKIVHVRLFFMPSRGTPSICSVCFSLSNEEPKEKSHENFHTVMLSHLEGKKTFILRKDSVCHTVRATGSTARNMGHGLSGRQSLGIVFFNVLGVFVSEHVSADIWSRLFLQLLELVVQPDRVRRVPCRSPPRRRKPREL